MMQQFKLATADSLRKKLPVVSNSLQSSSGHSTSSDNYLPQCQKKARNRRNRILLEYSIEQTVVVLQVIHSTCISYFE